MVKIIYVNEEIHYDKTKLCGWSYREITYRVDFKKRDTRFVIYKGYCQRDYEQYSDHFTEVMSIYSTYNGFPTEKERFNKEIRTGYTTWRGKIIYD